MEVEIRFLDLLREHGIPTHGMVKELAAKLGITRQATAKLIKGDTKKLNYIHLGKMCDFLLEVAREYPSAYTELRFTLPGALLGFSGLWDRLLRKKNLHLCLGERCSYQLFSTALNEHRHHLQVISGADSKVATEIIHKLSVDGGKFNFEWKNIPFFFPWEGEQADPGRFRRDASHAREIYEHLSTEEDSAIVLIGSQRANLLSELNICTIYQEPGIFRSFKTV